MDLEWLRGETLLHTDYNPLNILIYDGRAHIIDWAWPTRGAAFIDSACLVLRLLAAGHTPTQAETSVAQTPAWNHAFKRAIDTFAVANSRLWRQIATDDPHPWKAHMAAVVDQWAEHRLHRRHSHCAPTPQPARARNHAQLPQTVVISITLPP
jgi:Ser/Thr protein kinase RdoA (MazF antagonist)